ncbi:hypothetical protein EYF80_020403 [Liparis tanakae]|uniref:Uncharacterized protein n=1 Tax=Liparis tanakae TaxID=230148 RepID=A0A4Z2HWX3_9TELE|nr:hypothetical protein EYF80_020403 [Liparis tanakae]
MDTHEDSVALLLDVLARRHKERETEAQPVPLFRHQQRGEVLLGRDGLNIRIFHWWKCRSPRDVLFFPCEPDKLRKYCRPCPTRLVLPPPPSPPPPRERLTRIPAEAPEPRRGAPCSLRVGNDAEAAGRPTTAPRRRDSCTLAD